MARRTAQAENTETPNGVPKKHVSGSIRAPLAEELRAFATRFGGHPDWVTISQLIEEAVEDAMPKFRARWNGGKPVRMPEGGTRVRRGRPLKVHPTSKK